MVTDGDPAAVARPKLPVWRTVIESYRFVFANFGHFLALAWFPFAMSFSVILIWLLPSFLIWYGFWMVFILIWAASAVLAVRWHRFVLLDDHAGVLSELLSRRNLRFFGLSAIFLLVEGAPMIGVHFFIGDYVRLSMKSDITIWFQISAFLYVCFTFFVMVMLSLLLPSIAIDRPLGLVKSWHILDGKRWRFAAILLLTIVPTEVGGYFLLEFIQPGLGSGIQISKIEDSEVVAAASQIRDLKFYLVALFYQLLETAVFLVGLGVGVTALSATYRRLVGVPEHATDATAAS